MAGAELSDNASRSALVHSIGYPASGKLTVALALERLAGQSQRRFVVLDNHRTSSVVLAVVGADGFTALPPAVWDRVAEVREAVIQALEELAPDDLSFIFTNVLTQDKPADMAVVERLQMAAARTNRRYLPVVLDCTVDVIAERASQTSRQQRGKWTDPVAVRRFVDTTPLLDVSDLDPLRFNTSSRPPDDIAAAILKHLDGESAAFSW